MAKYKYPLGTAPTVCPANTASERCILSVTNIKPISIKNERANIWIDGLRFTKLPTGVANSIIIATESTTAAIII